MIAAGLALLGLLLVLALLTLRYQSLLLDAHADLRYTLSVIESRLLALTPDPAEKDTDA